MGDWIDFAEVRAKVSLEDVLLTLYGLGDRLQRNGHRLVGPCPIHGGDAPRAFQADLEKNVWFCHSGCRRGGNSLDFVAAMDKVSIRDAALKLQATLLSGESSARPPTATRPNPFQSSSARAPPSPTSAAPAAPASTTATEEAANPPLEEDRLNLGHDHPHLLKDRGLTLETATRFGAGYCARGLLRGMIAIPVHDEDGDLVAYAGRRLKAADIREHGKYRFPTKFRKDLILYNLHRAKDVAAAEGLILVEGFFAVMSLDQGGVRNAVASMGCSLSEAQAALLAELGCHVAIAYDGDESGRGGSADALARLEAKGVAATRIVLPEGTVPEDHPPRLLRWAASGGRLLGLREITFTRTATPIGAASAPPPAS